MGAVLALDVGRSTGVALHHGRRIATDTIAADDLHRYLCDVGTTLAHQNVFLDTVVAEQPLTIFRSALSRELEGLCLIVGLVFPQVRWIEASAWKPLEEPLRRYARSRHLLSYRSCRTPHERDALLIALWCQGALDPAKSP
jgi:hypothetical protein